MVNSWLILRLSDRLFYSSELSAAVSGDVSVSSRILRNGSAGFDGVVLLRCDSRNTQISERSVIKFPLHKALKLIACGKLTFDERVVVHRVVRTFRCALY